jgi:hypothetical protein
MNLDEFKKNYLYEKLLERLSNSSDQKLEPIPQKSLVEKLTLLRERQINLTVELAISPLVKEWEIDSDKLPTNRVKTYSLLEADWVARRFINEIIRYVRVNGLHAIRHDSLKEAYDLDFIAMLLWMSDMYDPSSKGTILESLLVRPNITDNVSWIDIAGPVLGTFVRASTIWDQLATWSQIGTDVDSQQFRTHAVELHSQFDSYLKEHPAHINIGNQWLAKLVESGAKIIHELDSRRPPAPAPSNAPLAR